MTPLQEARALADVLIGRAMDAGHEEVAATVARIALDLDELAQHLEDQCP